jgi:Spy/CpxP family protein refolding chaperone
MVGLMAALALGLCALTEAAQPPGGKDKGPGGKKGPPGFELGRVMPPFVRDMLQLTDQQEKQIDDLEKDIKTKLLKILTPEQQQKVMEFKGPPGKGGFGPPPKDGKDKGPPPPPDKS